MTTHFWLQNQQSVSLKEKSQDCILCWIMCLGMETRRGHRISGTGVTAWLWDVAWVLLGIELRSPGRAHGLLTWGISPVHALSLLLHWGMGSVSSVNGENLVFVFLNLLYSTEFHHCQSQALSYRDCMVCMSYAFLIHPLTNGHFGRFCFCLSYCEHNSKIHGCTSFSYSSTW